MIQFGFMNMIEYDVGFKTFHVRQHTVALARVLGTPVGSPGQLSTSVVVVELATLFNTRYQDGAQICTGSV